MQKSWVLNQLKLQGQLFQNKRITEILVIIQIIVVHTLVQVERKEVQRASLIKDALLTNNVTIIPNALLKLNTDKK